MSDACTGPQCDRPSVSGAPAIAIASLSYQYPGGGRTALADIDLSVPAGRCIALIGHNGSGKSTLLRCLAGALTPSAGTVRTFGHAAGSCRHRVALLPQRSGIDWSFPVSVERLVLGGRAVHLGWWRRPGHRELDRVHELLDRLQLSSLAGERIDALSGGQQQRALLARTLVQEADLLLLDEPLNAIDIESREILAGVLTRQREQGRTIVVATHDLGPGRSFYDLVVGLHEGRQIAVPEDRLAELCQQAGCSGHHA